MDKSNRLLILLCIALTVVGCTKTAITPVARNQALISTSAAPICGTTGAVQTANRMAAVATLRQGYERYIIVSGSAQNNTRLVSTGPTFANTTGTFNRTGNTIYGNTNTVYGGNRVIVAGSNDAQMGVVMFNIGDQGYENALDARTTLGPEWEKTVKEGINTCL